MHLHQCALSPCVVTQKNPSAQTCSFLMRGLVVAEVAVAAQQVTREASISDNWESADQPTLPAPSAKRQDAVTTADGRRQCAPSPVQLAAAELHPHSLIFVSDLLQCLSITVCKCHQVQQVAFTSPTMLVLQHCRQQLPKSVLPWASLSPTPVLPYTVNPTQHNPTPTSTLTPFARLASGTPGTSC